MRESSERGKEVEILVKFQRHGLREGTRLTDLGRQITQERAEQGGWSVGDTEDEARFDAAKAIGSSADTPQATPENPRPLSRALETAHITAATVAGERAGTWNPRPDERLNYNTLRSPAPYDHILVYNRALSEAIRALGKGDQDLKDLKDEEKLRVTEAAQNGVMEHVHMLRTPEAEQWKRENAGMFADMIEHYIEMTRYLKNNSRVMYAAGTHGGAMEWLLQQALTRTDADGRTTVGLDSLAEIGGGFQSSDAYNVDIKTDKRGKLQTLGITFDNPQRPQGEMYLDLDKLHELAAFYRGLHQKQGGE